MYRSILRCSAHVKHLIRLHRAANRRRGRTLVPVTLVVGLGLGNRIERVERGRVVELPWRERMVFSRQGWQWQPPAPPPTPAAEPVDRAADDRVHIVDVRGRLPHDPRIKVGTGYSTVRYGYVAVGYLDVSDLAEVETGRRDVRKWIAPDGKLYTYEMGIEPGDPYTFNIYPPVSGEGVGK